ncbi:ATP-binding protein [Paludibacterium paludis]|uniref:histidine kinase n=1 Tax=Paludibacterium paludis TaxID=1225769 RepID=A0A918U9K0_9NEIS|nr:ATP-binding protein [Paludibacterium paludis]GGY16289.1 two-component sensor histidine kinase [Paludibacterium paludis]
MLRFFLRLYCMLVLGFIAAVPVINWVVLTFFPATIESYNHEAVRGQLYTLVEQLSPLPRAERARKLEEWRPHYGLKLALVDAATFPVSDKERDLLTKGRFISRDDFIEYVTPMRNPADGQWLRVSLPPEPTLLTSPMLWFAYSFLAMTVGALLWLWVFPLWRDLQLLKEVTQKLGEGVLRARVGVSKRSTIRDLAEHFNRMSDKIAELINNQRDLTNALSHELRTPLARLTFELDMLRSADKPAERNELIDDMAADVRELDDMVSELLAYARLEHRGSMSTCSRVVIASWLEEVVGHVELEARARDIECVASGDTSATGVFEVRAMTRAAVNLLRNAIRYAERRVEIRFAETPAGQILTIADDGPGIPPADRLRVFEPFTRLDESRDRTTGGFGLGLAIVRRIVRWHGGSIEIGEAELGGALFTIILPARPGSPVK